MFFLSKSFIIVPNTDAKIIENYANMFTDNSEKIISL